MAGGAPTLSTGQPQRPVVHALPRHRYTWQVLRLRPEWGFAPAPGQNQMYIINVKSHYDSAHFIRDYHGKCERLHGHRYEVEAALAFDDLGAGGIAYDFADFKRHLRAVTDELDHQNLNELPAFAGIETSAENQARHIYDTLKGHLAELADKLLFVRVWETPNQYAEYSER